MYTQMILLVFLSHIIIYYLQMSTQEMLVFFSFSIRPSLLLSAHYPCSSYKYHLKQVEMIPHFSFCFILTKFQVLQCILRPLPFFLHFTSHFHLLPDTFFVHFALFCYLLFYGLGFYLCIFHFQFQNCFLTFHFILEYSQLTVLCEFQVDG